MIEQQFIEQIELLEYMQYSVNLVPGFQQAIGFFYHPIHKQTEAVILNKTSNLIKKISQNDAIISHEINSLRYSKVKYEWVDKSLIPFEQNNDKHIQKKVFDELDYYILLLRVDSTYDNQKDLLYIYFKPDASNFGLKSLDSNLNPTQKGIIASLVVNSFAIFHQQRIRFQNENNLLRNDNRILGEQFNSIQLKSKIESANTKNKIYQYIVECLNSESKKLNVNLKLSSESQDYLKSYDGKISSIDNSAKQAIKMAYRSQLTPEDGILKIEDYHLRAYFEKEDMITESIGIESLSDSRFHRTIQLLNRLESAAKKVQANGNSLTGSAVGQAMDNPISAPAISDALKKHKNKIQTLCKDFPEEWLTIRKSFKPIMNALSA
jgi:hypothetical protein